MHLQQYLIVWGGSPEAVRAGTGENEEVAAKYAFGTYDPARMSFLQLTLKDMRSDSRRTKMAYKLLLNHAAKMNAKKEYAAAANTSRTAEELKRVWAPNWKRLKGYDASKEKETPSARS